MLTQYEVNLNSKVNIIETWGNFHQPLRQGMVEPGYKGLIIPFPSPKEKTKVPARNRNFLTSSSYPVVSWRFLRLANPLFDVLIFLILRENQ